MSGPDGGVVVVDERLAGVGAAGAALALKLPFGVVVLAAAVTTAALRAVTG